MDDMNSISGNHGGKRAISQKLSSDHHMSECTDTHTDIHTNNKFQIVKLKRLHDLRIFLIYVYIFGIFLT